MPSGAKKRKAAKKKKEKEANIDPLTINPQGNDEGNDELKSQDEKGSDGGEDSSPAYHDNDDHHHPSNEGNVEVEERDPSASQPSAAEAESMEEVPGDVKIGEADSGKEDSLVMIERDLKSEESSESNNVVVEHVESAKESYYGNGNSNGTSYDESPTEKNPKDELYNSINDEAITTKTSLITENAPVAKTGNLSEESSVNTIPSVSEVKTSDTESVLLEKSIVPPVGVTDLAMKQNEDNIYPLTDENARTSSLGEPKPKEHDSGIKVLPSLSASPFMESTNDTEHIQDSETPECSENQPLVTSARRMVQKTSWLSCCGLFEVISGSNT